jgi:hypothetical protein
LDRDAFLTLAHNEQAKLLRPFRQHEWLVEGAYWAAVTEALDKLPTIRNPRAYLKHLVKWRVTDAIRDDIHARQAFTGSIGAPAHWERGLEYWDFDKIVDADDPKHWAMKFVNDPGVTETYSYLDFKQWLQRQVKTDAEVLLRKSTTTISHGDLGKQFGRNRHWSKRVYMRMAKKLIRETGVFPHQIEHMVAEALRRHVNPLPVVHVTLGRWEGREEISYTRERWDVHEFMA